MSQSSSRRRMALAARAVLEGRAGEWVTAVDLIRAGVEQPAAAIAYARRALGLKIEQQVGRGRWLEYRLEEPQLGLGEELAQ